MKIKYYLYGCEISFPHPDRLERRGGVVIFDPEKMAPLPVEVPRKGDHLHWNGTLLEVAMVVWANPGTVHLYLFRDPFNNPLPAGLDESCDPSSLP